MIFKCSAKSCNYQIICNKNKDGYYILDHTSHTCLRHKTISKKELEEAVFKVGKVEQLTMSYQNAVCKKLNIPEKGINTQRIRNAYNRVFKLSKNKRIKSWRKLASFIEIIKANGGYGLITKNDGEKINFVGFVPDYSVTFLRSSLFFGVVQMDTRFQTGVSGGNLYTMIGLTGDRTILPIGAAWAPSESSESTDKFLSMLQNELYKIKSCQTDESLKLIKSIEKVGIISQLCNWHLEKHIKKNKAIFKVLVSSENSHDYAKVKHKINTKYPKLKEKLDENNKWSKITRFECNSPRDQNISTACVESLNAFIARLKLKDKEPLDVFLQIYEFGFFQIKEICSQNTYLTRSASDWLTYAFSIAHNLTVTKTPLNCGKYEVTKGGCLDSKCTVFINNNEIPSCSCKFFFDCGMPCVHMLAVACKYNFDWCSWIHPRFFPAKYKNVFQNNLIYPDFDQIISTNKDVPVIIKSLKRRQKRIPTPGDVPPFIISLHIE